MKTATSASSIEELKAQVAASRGSFSGSFSPSTHTTAASSSIPNPFQATPQQPGQGGMQKMPFGTAKPMNPTSVPNSASFNASINNNNNNFLSQSVSKSTSLASTAQVVNGILQRDQLKYDLGELLQGELSLKQDFRSSFF